MFLRHSWPELECRTANQLTTGQPLSRPAAVLSANPAGAGSWSDRSASADEPDDDGDHRNAHEAAERVQFRAEPPWKHRRTRVLLRALGGVLLFLLGFFAGSCWQRGRLVDLAAPRPAVTSR